MKTSSFSIVRKDDEMTELVGATGRKTLALRAIACANRVMPFFEENRPEDSRPRQALETLERWIATGILNMKVARKTSLGAHAAARDVAEESPARSAARAAGQAVATAHVRRHAYGAAISAQQAIDRSTGSLDAVERERNWQY